MPRKSKAKPASNPDPNPNDGRQPQDEPPKFTPQDDANDSLLNAPSVPSFQQMADAAREMFEGLIQVLETTPRPSLEVGKDVLSSLGVAKGVPGTQDEAFKMARKVCGHIERLGLGLEFYSSLIGLASPVSERPPATQAYLLETLASNSLHRGKPSAARESLRQLLKLARHDSSIPLMQALLLLLGAGSFLNGDKQEMRSAVGEMILKVAEQSRDQFLAGDALNTLALVHLNNYQHQKCYDMALRAFAVGAQVRNSVMVAVSLHYMGLAKAMLGETDSALVYLQAASDENEVAADYSRRPLIQVSLATQAFYAGKYPLVVEILTGAIDQLNGRGYYLAQAKHIMGMAFTELGEFPQAEPLLKQAIGEYDRWKMRFDRTMARHALAYMYFKAKQYEVAVHEIEQAYNECRRLRDTRRPWLQKLLAEDRANFRKARGPELR